MAIRTSLLAVLIPLAACTSMEPASRSEWIRTTRADRSASSRFAQPQSSAASQGSAPSAATGGDEVPVTQGESDEPFILPFFADAARERGYDLPLPLGIGANLMVINRPTEVTSVRAGVNNNGMTELDALSIGAEASVRTAVARLDAWVLPMLNVYFLGGYIWNTSAVDVVVDLPSAPNTEIKSSGDLEGPTYGVGATLAGGYEQLFASLDFNITRSDLGELSKFIAKLTTVRVGWNGKVNDTDVRAYTGATYWDTKRTIEGSFATGGGPVQSVQFSVDQEPVDPITLLVGTSVTVSDSFWLLLELQGWQGTQALIAGVSFRF